LLVYPVPVTRTRAIGNGSRQWQPRCHYDVRWVATVK